MAVNVYDVGDRVRLQATFMVGSNPTNPTVTQCKVRSPNGVITTIVAPEVVNDSLGAFHVDISVDAEGRWIYKWIGTGAVEAVQERYLTVRPPKIP